jgi:hypothetical protein
MCGSRNFSNMLALQAMAGHVSGKKQLDTE